MAVATMGMRLGRQLITLVRELPRFFETHLQEVSDRLKRDAERRRQAEHGL